MNSLTALIIDDESLARFTLRNKLAEFPEIEIIGEAASLKEAEEKIKVLNPVLLFLDIQLPDGSGFDLFNLIKRNCKKHLIILTSIKSRDHWIDIEFFSQS